MATALSVNSCIGSSSVYVRRPRPLPSPPLEDPQTLRTLPSIQSLISMDISASSQDIKAEQDTRQKLHGPSQGEIVSTGHRPPNFGQPTVSHPDNRPPSPPIDPQLGFNGPIQSPSAESCHTSTATGTKYQGGAFNNLEPHTQSQHPRAPSQTGAMVSPLTQSPYQDSPYSEPPSTSPPYAFASPTLTGPQPLYYQHPLPSTFPSNVSAGINPTTPTSSETSPVDPNNSQWQQQHQHHHYIAPSASAAFPGQNSDRYVCQVCNKAFSRPSSLKIHSHSHTGEKPFICPHKGCGKAFSVRSNMKRHERGCHGSGSTEDQ
ncbi:MAG: hypothetical protein Q9164_005993 [Protoblastenia rupestris]